MVGCLFPSLLAASAARAQDVPKATILGPGVYVMDELSGDPEGQWLGLVQTPDGTWRLEEVTVRVDATPLEGDSPLLPSGLRVAVPGGGRVLLLIRDMAFPSAEVAAANVFHLPSELPSAQTIFCDLGPELFKVWGETVKGTDKAVVKLTAKGSVQELYMLADTGASSWDVLWAGDLDGDGAADLLVAVAEMGTGRIRLLLSGMAKSQDLVGQAAEHTYSFGN